MCGTSILVNGTSIYLKFIKRVLNVKQSTNTCMVCAETGRYPLSFDITVNMVR